MKYAEYLTEFIGRKGSLGLNGTVASLTYGESNMTSHKIVEVHEDFVVIVIIEFKRPARNAYSDEENPIDQVIRYVGSIKEGKAKDKSGRHIVIPENMPFYAYILCDLTPKIQQYARERDYTPAPDSQGYFSYHKAYKTYIEIISYDKLVNDAKKRNQVLFDKLSLPL